MKYEAESSSTPKHWGFFEPFKETFKNQLFKNNGIIKKISQNVEYFQIMHHDVPDSQISELLRLSQKPEDWLEICFYSEQNSSLNHEKLWLGGLEKFNSSALYLENLGYFYYQKGTYHKALDYLSKSQALEKSFFALTLAIAASYAVTQYNLVLDYFQKLGEKEQNKLNDDLLFKVATAAQYEQKYEMAIQIFESIKKQNKVPALPTLQDSLLEKFGDRTKMQTWSNEMYSKIDQKNHRAKLSIDELITFASVLIYENKFDTALKHLENVKRERFN